MRQQYDRINQSIFSSKVRSVLDSGTSPHTNLRTRCNADIACKRTRTGDSEQDRDASAELEHGRHAEDGHLEKYLGPAEIWSWSYDENILLETMWPRGGN